MALVIASIDKIGVFEDLIWRELPFQAQSKKEPCEDDEQPTQTQYSCVPPRTTPEEGWDVSADPAIPLITSLLHTR